jgi:cyanate lyase
MYEKFGDGIISAVDHKVTISKKDEGGVARVQILLDGKFLPYTKW